MNEQLRREAQEITREAITFGTQTIARDPNDEENSAVQGKVFLPPVIDKEAIASLVEAALEAC